MKFNLELGDTIYYGNGFDFKHEDVIESEIGKNNKLLYFGIYEGNKTRSEHFKTLNELLSSYLNSWENVKVIKNGREYILKDFRRDIDVIKAKGRVVLERKITDDIKIEILKYSEESFKIEKMYYLEYDKGELVKVERI